MNTTETFHGITIIYTDKLVQIVTDQNLKNYLNQKGKKDARNLAKHILEQYRSLTKKDLAISEDSLTVEILIHVYLDQLSNTLQKPNPLIPKELKSKLLPLLKNIESHTEIIDCGEKSVDSNRHIFDSLSRFKSIITLLLEK